MKSFNAKLVLSALGIALIATPAFAQQRHRQLSPRGLYDYQVPPGDPSSGYPNPVARGGSEEQYQSGGMFNLGR